MLKLTMKLMSFTNHNQKFKYEVYLLNYTIKIYKPNKPKLGF